MRTVLAATFNQRQIGDYDIDSEIVYEEALETLDNSKLFLDTVIQYLRNNGYLHHA